MKIRKGDKVEVISGKSKYKKTRGEVEKVFLKTNRVLVKGVNIVTKHVKKMGSNPGQIVKMEKPVDASTLMFVCPFIDKATRLGYVMVEEKKGVVKKYRYSKRALKEKGGKASDFIIK